MAELDRSLTNIDWLISCSQEKQPIKSKSEKTHFCGNCLHCSRLRSRPRADKTYTRQSDTSPAPSSPLTPSKPPHSYVQIIATAIRTSANQKMTLNEIYSSVMDTYPYFRNATSGWKNSVRHNLSLNRIFRRVSRPKGEPGKGAYWEVDETAAQKKRVPKSPHKKHNVTSPAPMCPPFTPFCPLEAPNYLNQSFTAFYRTLLERSDDVRQTDPLRGQEDVSESGEMFANLKDSFSTFLRGLSVSGGRTGTETNYPSEEVYHSDASSSQEFDWNAIL